MSNAVPHVSRWATPAVPSMPATPGYAPVTTPFDAGAFDPTLAFPTTRTPAPPTVVVGVSELAAAIAEVPPSIPPGTPEFVGHGTPTDRPRHTKALGVSVVALLLLGGAAGGALALRTRSESTVQTAPVSHVGAVPGGAGLAGASGAETAPGAPGTAGVVGPVGTVGMTGADGRDGAGGTPGSTNAPSSVAPTTVPSSTPTTQSTAPTTQAAPSTTTPATTAPTTPPTTAVAKAKVTSVHAPAVWSCGTEAPNVPAIRQLTLSWTSTNATRVSVGIDSPSGTYADNLPANGSLVVPAPCQGDTQTYYITAYGPNGSNDTASTTTEGRA